MSEIQDEEFCYYLRIPEMRIGYGFNSNLMAESFSIWMENGKWIVQHSINHTTFLEV